MNARKSLLTKLTTGLAALALVLTVQVTSASAATLQIQISGLNFVYTDAGAPGGGTLCDATSCAGGGVAPNPAVGDPVVTMNFFVDNVLVGQLNNPPNPNLNVDFLTTLTGGINAVGPTLTTTSGGHFDMITSAAGWGLALNLGDGIFAFGNNVVSFIGAATVNSIFFQDLPFGLEIGMPIEVSYSASATITSSVGGFHTGLVGAGTGEVIGATAVPEPASILLLGSGLAFAARQVRRRRASR